MLIAASMASQSALNSRTGAGMEDNAEMAKQMRRHNQNRRLLRIGRIKKPPGQGTAFKAVLSMVLTL
jgi:hypothetical protein